MEKLTMKERHGIYIYGNCSEGEITPWICTMYKILCPLLRSFKKNYCLDEVRPKFIAIHIQPMLRMSQREWLCLSLLSSDYLIVSRFVVNLRIRWTLHRIHSNLTINPIIAKCHCILYTLLCCRRKIPDWCVKVEVAHRT